MAETLDDNEVPIVNGAHVLAHPLRRHLTGPTDVEWALFVQKVDNMDKALANLIAAVERSNELASRKCESCAAAKVIDDHERRLREMERMIWKATGLAAAVAGLTSFILDRVFNK